MVHDDGDEEDLDEEEVRRGARAVPPLILPSHCLTAHRSLRSLRSLRCTPATSRTHLLGGNCHVAGG